MSLVPSSTCSGVRVRVISVPSEEVGGVSVTVIASRVLPAGLSTSALMALLKYQACLLQSSVLMVISSCSCSEALLALGWVGLIASWGLRLEASLQLRPPLASGSSTEVNVLLTALLGSTVRASQWLETAPGCSPGFGVLLAMTKPASLIKSRAAALVGTGQSLATAGG